MYKHCGSLRPCTNTAHQHFAEKHVKKCREKLMNFFPAMIAHTVYSPLDLEKSLGYCWISPPECG
jgi:hypothetical protein